ncbi:MAG: serine/threonine-protein kinase [Wenzhouxiangellaceae bacterium]
MSRDTRNPDRPDGKRPTDSDPERDAGRSGDPEAEKHDSDIPAGRKTHTSPATRPAEEPPSSFLATPAAARLAGGDAVEIEIGIQDPAALSPEERYELGACLGEGGMGRVYRAHDLQLGRDVALKFLNHHDPHVRQMFLREARAQARVRHPHVLDVFDSGVLDGQPFVSMRLIDGQTLAGIAPRLSLEELLGLLIQACEGLHAAHVAGLAHRDVKPANILVEETPDGEFRAQIADFGLAVELADRAEPGGLPLAGSPQYMAPERLLSNAVVEARRADIYSLGMTMYRVLAGTLPFADQEFTEIIQARRAGTARPADSPPLPPPRQFNPSLPAEVEAIILRCAAPEPGRRYSSARAVAADLRRYLDGEVVEAYAAGLAYRLTRFVLRNRVLVMLTGVTIVAILAATIAVGIFAIRADSARHRAELRQAQAEELIRFMVVDLHEKLEDLGRLDVMSDVGDAALEYFAAVPDEVLSDDERLRRSRALYQIGQVQIRQGANSEAIVTLEMSLELAQQLVASDSENSERLYELGQSHFWLGYLHWRQGELESARDAFESYRDVSARLVALDPDNPEWLRELAHSHSNLGSLLRAEGNLDRALEEFRSGLEIDISLARDQAGDQTGEQAAQGELAASNNMVGLVLQDLGRIEEAAPYLERNLAIRRELFDQDPASPRSRDFLATSLSDIGVNLSVRGKWAEAESRFRESRGLLQALTRHDPENTSWRFKLTWTRIYLARVALNAHDSASARAHLDAAADLAAPFSEPDSTVSWRRTRGVIFYYQAVAARSRGDFEAARVASRKAVDTLEALSATQPADRTVHRWLAQAHVVDAGVQTGAAQARRAYRRSVDAAEPFLQQVRERRMLLPWAIATHCLGNAETAGPVRQELERQLYSEPGQEFACAQVLGQSP